ncbi:MAG TPA: gliding motility-associated C-terminal domain-containing protein, partial [Puia sp.]|nr:gliding motility-associated C-terminal domain-containing protein [Puia sp.]
DRASFTWSAPDGWSIDSGSNGNSVKIKAGPQPGWIVARQSNSCTSLTDSLFVHLYKGALPQASTDPRDTTVCYGSAAPLQAMVTTGTEYTWANGESLRGSTAGAIPSLPFIANVVAAPALTTDYLLTIRNEGCPISVTDTFTVNVVPPIRVDPGHDTLVVIGEPLQFHATSSDLYRDTYQWSPSTDLSNPNTDNPVGIYGSTTPGIVYQVTATDSFGCSGAASVKVTIATTLPDIFVPNAFTPSASRNNLFRPVCIGISSLEFFHIYNRWGQLVFSTSQIGQGWDGTIQGQAQQTNTYLWMVKGTDYTGKVISKKGTVVLLR